MMAERFPSADSTGEQTNPAIQVYGRRFYMDQTPVEYLAEFLLVFASPKGPAGADTEAYAFRFSIGENESRAIYWPEDRVALKLFSFFSASKLDTRHETHQKAYREALHDLAVRVKGTDEEKDEAIRLLQSLLGGFVGVAKNRTWATYTFLPASSRLLARELDWLNSRARMDLGLSQWQGARQYFAHDRHNFMARGGEVLFLQLAHLFQQDRTELSSDASGESYAHLRALSLDTLRSEVEGALHAMLQLSALPLNQVARFVERALEAFRLYDKPRHATLGWVPTATLSESHLFAFEVRNIAISSLADLQKLNLMQSLCCMQVLRTLCSQATRMSGGVNGSEGFAGGYAWITANPDAPPGSSVRKLAQASFEKIERLLFAVLRKDHLSASGSLTEADKHGFQIFRRLAKEIGLVIPRTGPGQRFVLPPHLLQVLVAALLEPGEHIRLDEFYARVFAHYGIALGDRQLAVALAWGGAQTGSRDYAVAADTRWIEETLRQGGFLVELSDAVSIVHNPGARD